MSMARSPLRHKDADAARAVWQTARSQARPRTRVRTTTQMAMPILVCSGVAQHQTKARRSLENREMFAKTDHGTHIEEFGDRLRAAQRVARRYAHAHRQLRRL